MADDSTVDIKALRAERGWTQDQLAEHLGVDRSTVSRLETGAEPSGPVKRLLAILATQPVEARVA